MGTRIRAGVVAPARWVARRSELGGTRIRAGGPADRMGGVCGRSGWARGSKLGARRSARRGTQIGAGVRGLDGWQLGAGTRITVSAGKHREGEKDPMTQKASVNGSYNHGLAASVCLYSVCF